MAINNTIPVALTAIDSMNGQMQIVVVLRDIDAEGVANLARMI